MAQLTFVGLGLKLKHITLEAIESMKESDVIFLETYTSLSEDITPENLEKLVKKPVVSVSRRDVEEENGEKIFRALNEGKNVVFATIGDPFIATTHMALLLEALRRGYKVNVVHGLTIHSVAISYSGLMVYKFGQSATIVFPKDKIVYEHFYDVIKENKRRGLHTFLFLDLDAEKRVFMRANEALKLLIEIENRRRENVIKKNDKVLVIARAGSKNQFYIYGEISKLIGKDFGEPPHTIIIPGKLHFIEEEALRRFLAK